MKRFAAIVLSLSLVAPSLAVPLGNLGNGVTAKDSASGAGYILFSPEGLTSRFTLWPGQASHFAAVYHLNDTWYYYNNETPVVFTPLPTDVLVASVDYSADTATLLNGQDTFVYGIRTGYTGGDLGITVNWFAGAANPGKFTMTGTNIVLNTPKWWQERNVTNTNPPNNMGVANLGQAKHMVYQAYAELAETHLSGGAGFSLDSLFPAPPAFRDSAWYEAQKAPLNLGQLKAVAKPFYNRLNSISPLWVEQQLHVNGLSTLNTHYFKDGSTNYYYPWNPDTPVGENFKLATIGQLKAVFALRFNESSDGDSLPDLWEYQIINASGTDSVTSLADVTPEGDFDNDEVENLTEYQISTDPTVFSRSPVQWVSPHRIALDNSVPATPSLTKISGGTFWNAGARSARVLAGNGSVSASSTDGDTYTMFGLSEIHLNYDYRTIRHAVYFQNGQNIYVYENGSNRGLKTTYVPTDVLEVQRTGTTVQYLKNGVVFYTSPLSSTRPLYAVASFHRSGAILSNTTSTGFTDTLDTDQDGLLDSYELQIAAADPNDGINGIADVTGYGDFDRDGLSDAAEYSLSSDPTNTPNQGWMPIVWTNFTGTEISQPSGHFGSSLEKTSSSAGYNADATSTKTLPGDGGVSCRVGALETRSFIGLNLSDDSASHSDLTYSIYFEASGAFYVFENGSSKIGGGVYGLNDSFSIEREGDTVHYARNGKVFYTSSAKTAQPLIIDSSLYYQGSTLTHCLKRGFTEDPAFDLDSDGIAYNDEYALISQVPPMVAATIVDISETSDLDGDGVTDQQEIANGTDLLDIYSGGGSVQWPTDALVAWYRTDLNPPEVDVSGNVVRWRNSLSINDSNGLHIIPGSSVNKPTLVQGTPYPFMHSEENALSYIEGNGTDYLTSETDGFTILGHFKPTADSSDGSAGLLNNEQYLNSGFRFGRRTSISDKLMWWSTQSGGNLSLLSKEGLAINTSCQFTLSHHPGLNKYTSLYVNGEYQASKIDAVIKANTRSMYLQYIGGHKGQPADWNELIIAGRQLSLAEQTLLEDYLLAKHQNIGPLAGDTNNNGNPDWQDAYVYGASFALDSDEDGISDVWEQAVIDEDPNDSLNDLADISATSDFDLDGLKDLQEFTYGLNPRDKWDAMKDLDDDRVPTLYEIWKGTDPLDPVSVPAHDYIVDPVNGAGDPNDNIYATIQEAFDEIPTHAFRMIFVKPGTYNESVKMLKRTKALVLADVSGDVYWNGEIPYATVQITGGSSLSMDGFIMSGATGYYMNRDTGWDPAFDRTTPVIISNCIFHKTTTAILAEYTPLVVSHCTFHEAGPSNANSWPYIWLRKRHTSSLKEHYKITNCSIWSQKTHDSRFYNNELKDDAADFPGMVSGDTLELEYSHVRGGLYGGNPVKPVLNPGGILRANSNLINKGEGDVYVKHDIHGELRVNPDIGADEWVDSDTDNLPDFWETRHFGNLANDGNHNADGDGFTAIQEYELGVASMSPLINDDADSDGVPAAWDTDDNNAADVTVDEDGDGLDLLGEFQAGSNRATADTDNDGLTDKQEIDHGLNPDDWTDVMRDPDGDRVPNLWEIKLGYDINDSASKPAAHILVDPDNSSNPNTYATVAEAMTARSQVADSCVIIAIKPGNYAYNSGGYYALSISKPLLFLGESIIDSAGATSAGKPRLATLVANIKFSNGHVAFDGVHFRSSGLAQEIIYANSNMDGLLFNNCLFEGEVRNEDSIFSIGNETTWGVTTHCPSLINHCSFVDQTPGGVTEKFALSGSSGIKVHRIVENSLFYSKGVSGSIEEITRENHVIDFRQSLARGIPDSGGALSSDPQLTQLGYLLKATSPAIGLASTVHQATRDIMGQVRDAAPDIGAIEFIDVDGDGLPDWLENSGDIAANADEDGDLLTNLEEYEFGSHLWVTDEDQDGLDDKAEQTAGTLPYLSDTDKDGMPDGYEVQQGFEPLVRRDALDDKDGDLIPNIYEMAKQTDPNSAASPASIDDVSDWVVDAQTGAHSSSDNIFSNLVEAVAALNGAGTNDSDYYIILCKHGVYEGSVDLGSRRVLLLGTGGDGETVLKNGANSSHLIKCSHHDNVLSGLVFEPHAEVGGSKDAVVNVSLGTDRTMQFKMQNCLMRKFYNGSNSVGPYQTSRFIGLVEIDNGTSYISNCTFYQNSFGGAYGSVDLNYYGNLIVENSILQNYNGTSAEVNQVYHADTTKVTYANSLVDGGDAHLTRDGYIKHGSPAIDAAGLNAISKDVHGEGVAGSGRDIGADEFVDTDSDLVADSWERRHYESIANGATYDADEGVGDSATSLEEYENALNPADRDSDDDGFEDGDELHRPGGATDPHDPDTDKDMMLDGYEAVHDLDPNDGNDAVLDKDGDQIPNIHEWHKGTSPSLASEFPAADYIVNPGQAESDDDDNIYATLDEVLAKLAVEKSSGGEWKYQIVKIHPGLYEKSNEIRIEYLDGLALIADRSGVAGFPEFRINDSSNNVFYVTRTPSFVMDGLVISRENVPGYTQTGGVGVHLESMSLYQTSGKAHRIVNCLFKEHRKGLAPLYNEDITDTIYVDHCTFVNNSGHGSGASSSIKSRFSGAKIILRNSILWNPESTTSVEIIGGTVTKTGCYVRGIDPDPLVNQRYGFLKPGSPAIDSASVLSDAPLAHDYTGELRDASPDVGVDEFVDADGDGLSDSWEVARGLDVSTVDTDGNGVTDGADQNNNGILDGLEDFDGDGLTNFQENGFDENPSAPDGYNIVESVTPDRRWVDVQDAQNRSMSVTVKLYRTDDNVIVHFRKFRFTQQDVDPTNYPGVKDLHAYEVDSASLASIPLGALSGDVSKTITWDGMAGADYHGADVILPVIEMVDGQGTSHFHTPITNYYVPETSISQFPISGGGVQVNPRKTVWQNTPHSGTFGSASMIEPVIMHHKLFPNLVNHRPIFGETTTGNWIPFEEDGTPWTETGDAWMGTVGRGIEGDEVSINKSIKYFSVRRLPSASIACLNQHANVSSYSVESYESSAAHGEVVHATFDLDRSANVTLVLKAPDGQEMPLYYRDATTGNYVNAVNLDRPAGANDLEFFVMDYSDPANPKVLDNVFSDGQTTGHGHFKLREVNGNQIGDREYRRYWRVKFSIEDKRTGHVRTKWALVKAVK